MQQELKAAREWPKKAAREWTTVLLDRIKDRSARIGVLGLGLAGLFQAYELASQGFEVVGYDIDAGRVAAVGEARSPVSDVPSDELRRLVTGGRLRPTCNPNHLADREIILISVPTTVTPDGDPRVADVKAAAETVAAHVQAGPLVVVKSTGYPGMTEEVVGLVLARRFGEPGHGFHLAFVPERGDAGNRTLASSGSLPKIISGASPLCRELAAALYADAGGPLHLASSIAVAEAVKLHENVFRFVNIAYANEMANLCRRAGIDPFEVVTLAATKPFGFMPFWPGAGVGGMYLPVNAAYWLWTARRYGCPAGIVESAIGQNRSLPIRVAAQVVERLASEGGRPAQGAERPASGGERAASEDGRPDGPRVALLGLGYKKGSGDTRNSPSIRVGEILTLLGLDVVGMDPYVPGGQDGLPFEIREWDPAYLETVDLAVLLTDHPEFAYETLRPFIDKLLDVRGLSRTWPKETARIETQGGAATCGY